MKSIINKIVNRLIRFSESSFFPVLFYAALFLLIFSFNFMVPTDPDLGWHLRYGEEVVNRQNILTKDIYSHTYFGAKVIDTEWPIEAVTYFLYSHWSFLGIGIFFAIFTSLAFLIPVLLFRGNYFLKVLIILSALIASSSTLMIGGRPQNISWILFSLLFVLLLKGRERFNFKYLIMIPLLFLFWANSHPSFFLGLLLLMIFISLEFLTGFIKIIKFRHWSRWGVLFREQKTLIFIGITSLVVTFLRFKEPAQKSLDLVKGLLLPFNLAVEFSSSGSVRTSINEWLPPVFFDLSGLLFYLSIILSVAIFLVKKTNRNDYKNLVIVLLFIYFSTLSSRNIPYFFFIFIPLMIIYANNLTETEKLRKILPLLNLLTFFILTIYSVNQIRMVAKTFSFVDTSLESYSTAVGYPWKAIEFVKVNKPVGNMFNHYNWGGFLVWQLKEYPVFIDGRMPGAEIFNEYNRVIYFDDGWKEILEKYKVKWIIYARSPSFEEKIRNSGEWKEAYSDDLAVIFVKTD